MELIKTLYNKPFLKPFLNPIKAIYDFYRFRFVSDLAFINKEYKKVFGVYPNLNEPKTINEKIQWLKLNDRTPLHTICADKYQSREYIEQKIGNKYLVPLVFATKNVEEIKKDNIPNYPVIVKTNHDSGVYGIIVDRENYDYETLRNNLKKSLKKNHYFITKEWQYKNIEPRIIVERLIKDKNEKISDDYKIHCFNGKAKVVYVSVDREGLNKRNIYSEKWEPLMFTWAEKNKKTENIRGEEIEKPENFDAMLKLAEKVSEDFKYARIDFYNVDGKIFCGEITFHPGSGLHLIIPKKWDFILGEYLQLQ